MTQQLHHLPAATQKNSYKIMLQVQNFSRICTC